MEGIVVSNLRLNENRWGEEGSNKKEVEKKRREMFEMNKRKRKTKKNTKTRNPPGTNFKYPPRLRKRHEKEGKRAFKHSFHDSSNALNSLYDSAYNRMQCQSH